MQLIMFFVALLAAGVAHAAVPADPAKAAADALVAQGCKIVRDVPRFIQVECPDKPMIRIMRMPR